MRAFVTAMESEAAAVRPRLRPGERLFVSGVGKVHAAAATMRAICEGAGEIWNVGVCGGFGAAMAPGEIYGVRRAVQYDFDLSQVNGTAIGVLDGAATPYVELATPPELERFKWFRGWRTLATGDRFTNDEGDYRLVRDTLGAELRDMEGAAVAQVCRDCGVSCVALKCVANVVSGGSMTGQYAANRADALAALAAAMKEMP